MAADGGEVVCPFKLSSQACVPISVVSGIFCIQMVFTLAFSGVGALGRCCVRFGEALCPCWCHGGVVYASVVVGGGSVPNGVSLLVLRVYVSRKLCLHVGVVGEFV